MAQSNSFRYPESYWEDRVEELEKKNKELQNDYDELRDQSTQVEKELETMAEESEKKARDFEVERKELNKILAHSNEKVIETHYVADTIEEITSGFKQLLKVQAAICLKAELTKHGKGYGEKGKAESALKLFAKKHPAYEANL